MQNPESKTCPRCQKTFECNRDNISQCQCYGIPVHPALKSGLEQEYSDCLCRQCLLDLEKDKVPG